MVRISRFWWGVLLAAVALALGSALAADYSPPPRRPAPAASPRSQLPGGTAVAESAAAVVAPSPTPSVIPVDPRFRALAGATAAWGAYEGGLYRYEVPASWNGGLVLYAHGYRGEGNRIFVGDPPIREHLIASGYAWAASSYRGNGYRPDWGMDDTLALRDLFRREVGEPRWTVLYGSSMGGHVVTATLEMRPGVVQGALSECGAVTGIEQIDYIAAYILAAETISGVSFAGAVDEASTRQILSTSFLPVMGQPPALTERGRQFESVVKHLVGGDLPYRAEGFAARYAPNLFLQGNPSQPGPAQRAADTSGFQYEIDPGLGADAEDLNARVRRLKAEGDARAGANPVFAPFSGRITVPLLTLHTTGDHFVPFRLEQEYRRKADAAGTAGLLVQRAVRRPGHCDFRPAERTHAFDDLVAWIERGVIPEGEDLLSADSATLGLRWTTPLLPDDPAQP